MSFRRMLLDDPAVIVFKSLSQMQKSIGFPSSLNFALFRDGKVFLYVPVLFLGVADYVRGCFTYTNTGLE